MNVFGRFASGLPGAAIVTTILFLILAAMISQRQDIELSEDRSVDINVTRQLQDTSVQAQQEFQRPVLDQPPPPPPSVTDASFRPSVSATIGEVPRSVSLACFFRFRINIKCFMSGGLHTKSRLHRFDTGFQLRITISTAQMHLIQLFHQIQIVPLLSRPEFRILQIRNHPFRIDFRMVDITSLILCRQECTGPQNRKSHRTTRAEHHIAG